MVEDKTLNGNGRREDTSRKWYKIRYLTEMVEEKILNGNGRRKDT